MVLFDDVVEVLRLAHLDVRTGVGLNALDGGCVGAALVNGDLLGHTVQTDGLFKKASCGCVISLGTKQEVDRIAVAIDARYRYFHWPATLTYVSSIRQLVPTGLLRRRNTAANTGRILIDHR